jgi:predicted ferric reductase
MIWLQTTDDLRVYFNGDQLPGQWLYILSKLAALYASVALCLQAIYALVSRAAPERPWALDFHKALGLATFGCATLHVLLYLTAAAMRNKIVPFDMLLPTFSKGFYRSALSLGLLCWMLMAVVVAAGALRKYVPRGAWLFVHRVAPLVVALALLHGLLVGSEAKTTLLTLFYMVLGTATFAALLWRLRPLATMRRNSARSR